MSDATPRIPSKDGEPAWEAAYLHSPQGRWSESEFLQFHTNQMAELVDGRLEILPMPNLKHQRILRLLLSLVEDAAPPGSTTLFTPLPTRLFPGTIREPDLVYISPENQPGPEIEYPSDVDLVLEIVSKGLEARNRDYVDKRRDYAKAGIREYWIIDPDDAAVTVLMLRSDVYEDLGRFVVGETAKSELRVDVTCLLSA